MSFREYIVRTPETDRRMLRVPEDASSLPQQVVAMYSSNDGQSVADGASHRINFEDIVYDSHSAVTTGVGTWKFTAPKTGTYLVCASVTLENFGAASADTWKELHINKSTDGSVFTYIKKLARDRKASEEEDGISGSGLVRLNEGEHIAVYIFQVSGGAKTLVAGTTHNYVDIVLVGP